MVHDSDQTINAKIKTKFKLLVYVYIRAQDVGRIHSPLDTSWNQLFSTAWHPLSSLVFAPLVSNKLRRQSITCNCGNYFQLNPQTWIIYVKYTYLISTSVRELRYFIHSSEKIHRSLENMSYLCTREPSIKSKIVISNTNRLNTKQISKMYVGRGETNAYRMKSGLNSHFFYSSLVIYNWPIKSK